MSSTPIKVAITGAAGHIGYALVFRIASGQMFGADVPVELQLIELEPALKALEGVAMELEDCAFPLLKKITCTSELSVGMQDANWVILVGAVPRKAGMERSDLIKINGGIFTTQGQAINDHAARDVRTLVVGNPCNTNCLITMHHAPDIPNDQFFAMTMLDENRARTQLALKAGVDISHVTDMIIWGNHSATQYPDFFNAKILDKAANEVIGEQSWLETEFISVVQKRGAAIIGARGLSSAASAANGIVDSVRAITGQKTAENGGVFSLAVCSDGQYGAEPGLIVSYPCRIDDAGRVKVIEDWIHTDFAREKLAQTFDELRAEKASVVAAGLLNR